MKLRHFKRFAPPATFIFVAVVLCGCGDQKAKRIVNQAIDAHGGSAYEAFRLEFDFRNIHYTAARDGGIFEYTREFADSIGPIRDVLSNEGFTRYRNGTPDLLSEERKAAYTRSLNSVIYFALLPFGLNDKAVEKKWIEETTIDGKAYDVIRVTFDDTGGGEDHQDIYLYWFNKDSGTMDYLAYSYETDGGGMRFRKAMNARRVGGILLQDYMNYKPIEKDVPIERLQSLFVSDSLKVVSEIKLTGASVTGYKAED